MRKRSMRAWLVTMGLGVAAMTGLTAAGQQPTAPAGQGQGQGQAQGQGQGQRQGGGGRRPSFPEPLPFEDRTGFDAIFDGTTLKGWDGNPEFWRVENGVLVGESTAAKPLKENTFLIYRGSQPGDFELKLEYRLNSTNSGVQYRSEEVKSAGQWVLKGYQADIDFENRWTGQLYEERGRGFLALRGQATYVGDGKKSVQIASLESADALKALVKGGDWNQLHIIARGNMLIHVLNGHVMSVVIDDDRANAAKEGLLGFQMHTGPPMKVEFRNISLKSICDC